MRGRPCKREDGLGTCPVPPPAPKTSVRKVRARRATVREWDATVSSRRTTLVRGQGRGPAKVARNVDLPSRSKLAPRLPWGGGGESWGRAWAATGSEEVDHEQG